MNTTSTNPASSLNLSASNDGLEQLKQLFHEHFELNYTADSSLLDGYVLDFESFNEIFLKWIRQLNRTDSSLGAVNGHNKEQQSKKSLDFATKNSYFYAKKHQHSKYSSMNSYTPDTNDKDFYSRADCASSTHSSSSIPSASLSEEEESQHIASEFETTRQNLTDSSNSSFLIGDLTSENRQLKQIVHDLKVQLQNAEDTNSQMSHEIENHAEKIANLSRHNTDVSLKLESQTEENEYLRKQVELSKVKANNLESEINRLNIQARNLNFSLKKSEEEVLKLNSQYLVCDVERDKHFNDLNEQKVKELYFKSFQRLSF